jgi:hypothetical protein
MATTKLFWELIAPSRSPSCWPSYSKGAQPCSMRDWTSTASTSERRAAIFEAARSGLRAANARLTSLSRTEDAKSLEAALSRIDEAQRLAGQLNQDTNALAADAAKTVGDVLGCIAKR